MKIKLKDFLKSDKELSSGTPEHFLALLNKMSKEKETKKEVVSPYFLNNIALRKISSITAVFIFMFIFATVFNKSNDAKIASSDPEPSMMAVHYSEDAPVPAAASYSLPEDNNVNRGRAMAAPAHMEAVDESQSLEGTCTHAFSCALQKFMNFILHLFKL